MRGNTACDKCGQIDIIRVAGTAHHGPTDSGASISLGMAHGHINVDRYICGNCGYVETWVQPEDIEKLRIHFQTK